MQTSIRRATLDDEAALTALAWRLTDFELPPWRTAASIAEADAREMMSSVRAGAADNEVLIAERAGEPVGCLHVFEDVDFFGARHAHISVVATTAAAEGTGVGRMLMQHAEAWAAKRGLSLLTLNVFAGNTRAHLFYDRGGWTPELLKYAKRI